MIWQDYTVVDENACLDRGGCFYTPQDGTNTRRKATLLNKTACNGAGLSWSKAFWSKREWVNTTCLTQANQINSLDSNLVNSDWSSTDLTCDKIGNDRTTRNILKNLVQQGCCGTTEKKSLCWKDFSKICKDPSKYLPEKQPEKMEGQTSCKQLVENNLWLSQLDFSKEISCSSVSSEQKSNILMAGSAMECCSDKQSACSFEKKYICKNPEEYQPNYKISVTEASPLQFSCDVAISYVNRSALMNEDFSQTYTCSGKPDGTIKAIKEIAERGCCGANKRSACDLDLDRNGGDASNSVGTIGSTEPSSSTQEIDDFIFDSDLNAAQTKTHSFMVISLLLIVLIIDLNLL
jgi:hypothetical protein